MPTNNSINTGKPIEVANGGTGAATFTAYSVVTAGTTATGAFQNVSGLGTSGQVLTSAGAAALPTWEEPPYLKLIQSQTANNDASLLFTTGISSAHLNYMLLVSNFLPATNGANLLIQYSINGGVSYINTGYTGGLVFGYLSTIYNDGINSDAGFLMMKAVDNATRAGCGTYYLFNFFGGTQPSIRGTSTFATGGVPYSGFSMGYAPTVSNINAFKIVCSAGNITQGTFTLYGLSQ